MKNKYFDREKYYYLHNSGVDERIIFSSKEDFDRFEGYLYLLNAVESDRAANHFVSGRTDSLFESARGEKLIAIGAYSFLPNDFHILATSLVPRGISKFMQKLQTAYTMYFNKKYGRSGRLFGSTHKTEPALSDEHLKYIFAQIHFYPAKLFKDDWQNGTIEELDTFQREIAKYRYSSLNEYATSKFVITSPSEFPRYISRATDPNSYRHFLLNRKTAKM